METYLFEVEGENDEDEGIGKGGEFSPELLTPLLLALELGPRL